MDIPAVVVINPTILVLKIAVHVALSLRTTLNIHTVGNGRMGAIFIWFNI